MTNLPNEEDWSGYKESFDSKSAYESFFGKSNEQMQVVFFEDGIELMTEIRFMPSKAFKYYVLGLRDFIIAGNFQPHEASDFSSYFLDMIELLLDSETSLISSSMSELMPALEHIASNQDKYQAPRDIYGDYSEKLDNIKLLCEEHAINLEH